MLVADAVTMGSDAQGGHAFHEARRQPSEATIAQRGVGLEQADTLQVHIQPLQRITGDVQQPKVAQAVVQQTPDEELEGKVIDPLLATAVGQTGMVHPVVDHVIASGQGNGFEPVVVERMLRVLPTA